MNPIDSILMELEQEAATTARVLERVPEELLSWKPADKSISLGTLAHHIASNPKDIVDIIKADTYQVDPTFFETMLAAKSRTEILQTLTDSVEYAKSYIQGLTPDQQASLAV
jgi:hypothetical protein